MLKPPLPPARPRLTGLRPLTAGALALLLACALLPAPAQATPALTLAQAVQLAQQRSRQLVAQDATTSAARHMAVAASQLPDPVLKAGISSVPVSGPDAYSLNRDPSTMRSIGLMQEFVRSDKRQARARRFEREAEAALAARDLSLSNLQRDTTLAWLERYYQERLLALLAQQRTESLLQIEAADTAYRGARGAQADVLAARSAAAQLDDRLAQAEQQVASAKTQLARWIGDGAQQPLAELPDTSQVQVAPENLNEQLAHHPQIAVLARQEALAQADAQVALTGKQTDWSVEFMLNQLGANEANSVTINLTLPLQWDQKNRQDRELQAKLAVVEQMQAEREEATRAHVAEVQAMLQEWQSKRQRLSRYAQTLLPLARERINAALTAYRGGVGTLNAVLEARRSDIDTQIERLRLALETDRLWAQLNAMLLNHAATALASISSDGFMNKDIP
jgi:outer membrane protein TolC